MTLSRGSVNQVKILDPPLELFWSVVGIFNLTFINWLLGLGVSWNFSCRYSSIFLWWHSDCLKIDDISCQHTVSVPHEILGNLCNVAHKNIIAIVAKTLPEVKNLLNKELWSLKLFLLGSRSYADGRNWMCKNPYNSQHWNQLYNTRTFEITLTSSKSKLSTRNFPLSFLFLEGHSSMHSIF